MAVCAFLVFMLLVIACIVIGVVLATPSKVPSTYERNIVLLISLDGFRSDYLQTDLAPTLRDLASNGVSTEFLRPVFPTKTFPNHYSIVTGLYSESHGIVGNNFYDASLNDTFRLGQPNSFQTKWWFGEPIWITAKKHGLKSASYFWVGSEAIHPTYWRKFNAKVPWSSRIDQVISWMKLEESRRPAIITLYFEEPDKVGHKYGPLSGKVNSTIRAVDDTIKSLRSKLAKEGLTEHVNMVIVSDHGMAHTGCNKAIYLNQFTNLSDVSLLGLGASSLIYPKISDQGTKDVYEDLQCSNKDLHAFATNNNLTPRRMHYQNSKRIGDVFLMPETGFGILIRNGTCRTYINGYHGIDNTAREMQAIFIASGPDFKSGYKADHFQNIEIYNLLADLLQIPPAKNNGTLGSLRHMLKPSYVKKLGEISQNTKQLKQRSFPYNYSVAKDDCKSCVCSYCHVNISQNIDAYHTSLNLTEKEIVESHGINLPFGLPVSNGYNVNATIVLTQRHFVLGYHTSLHVPSWVAYKLAKDHLDTNMPRNNCFRRDIRLKRNESSMCKHYELSGYDRGHMAPSGDFNFDRTSEQDTFILSNIAPQHKNFNRSPGPWFQLEKLTREYSKIYGTLYVIAGSIFDDDNDGKMDKENRDRRWLKNISSGVAIPSHYYKILIKCNSSSQIPIDKCMENLDVLVFILPHSEEPICRLRSPKEYLQLHVGTITDVEVLTGLKFFQNMPFGLQMRMKTKLNTELW